MIKDVVAGKSGGPGRIVLANAAAALLAAERVPSLAEGVELACEAIATGRCRRA